MHEKESEAHEPYLAHEQLSIRMPRCAPPAALQIIGEATDGHTALTLLHTQPFEVVVLELMLRGQCRPHWPNVMKTEQPALLVLILTVEREQCYAVSCLRIGAAGYLTKRHASSEVLTAIHRLAAGHKYITPPLVPNWPWHWNVIPIPLR